MFSCHSICGKMIGRTMKSDATLQCSGKSERKRQEKRKRLPPLVSVFSVSEDANDEKERGKGREEMGKGARNDLFSSFRHAGLQRELVPHGDVSDRLLHAHSRCKSNFI